MTADKRALIPGEAEDVIPKGNLGNVMKSLGKQDPNHSVRPLDPLTLAWTAVNRETINGNQNAEAERISLEAALRAI